MDDRDQQAQISVISYEGIVYSLGLILECFRFETLLSINGKDLFSDHIALYKSIGSLLCI